MNIRLKKWKIRVGWIDGRERGNEERTKEMKGIKDQGKKKRDWRFKVGNEP